MHQILTKRLRILALTEEQLLLLAKGRSFLEKSLGLNLSELALSFYPELLTEFQGLIRTVVLDNVRDNPENYLLYTHWLLISKEKNVTIGGIGGSLLPGGEFLIGYFVTAGEEGKGIASEGLGGFLSWVKLQPLVSSVIADTPEDHIASQKVLKRNGFRYSQRVEEGIRWVRLPG